MRNFIYFSLLVFTLGLLASCGSTKSPGEAAKEYAQYIAEGKYKEYVDAIDFGQDATPENIAEQKELLLSFFQERGTDILKEITGFKSIDLVSEVISPDGNEAKVILLYTFENNKTSSENYEMIKVDGNWKIKFN